MMNKDEIVAYIESRIPTRGRQPAPFQGTSSTFESPHTCTDCVKVAVNVSVVDDPRICFECRSWEGVGEVASDERYRLCGHCRAPYLADSKVEFVAELPYSLSAAIGAAQAGCALYEWLVYVFIWNIEIINDSTSGLDWRTHKGLTSALPAFGLYSFTYTSDPNATCMLEFQLGPAMAELLPQGFYLYQPRLQCWTPHTDAASRFVTSRPYERDVKSAESMRFTRECFQICLEKHGRCRQVPLHQIAVEALSREVLEISHIPSRLLDVCPEDGGHTLKLVEIDEADEQIRHLMSTMGYVALSYCWGGDQPVKLTKASYQQLKTGFQISTLPQTLQDAVRVARNIEARYLWIDALCIFQDDKFDQAQEIGRMSIYYSGSKVTICAAASLRCVDGFLGMRQPAAYEVGPIRVSLRNNDGDVGHMYLLKEDELPAVEPTTTRAWTLQESLMSRRILIYAQKQLYWCCVTAYAGCGGDFVKLVDRVMGTQESLIENIYPMGSLLDRATHNQWKVIVEEFTKRQLAFDSDILLAVSALAANVDKLCKERSEKVAYLGGLFVLLERPTSWPSQLLWRSKSLASRRASVYRAPSWSWAAVTGPIQVDEFRLLDPDAESDSRVSFIVEKYEVDLEFATRPYGSVTGGFLLLQSRILPLGDYPLAPQITNDDLNTFDATIERLTIYPDTMKDKSAIKSSLATAPERAIFLVCLWVGEQSVYGLIAARTTNHLEMYTRIGIFHANRPSQVLLSCKYQTIRLE